jgi:hypothetical protein
MAQFLPAPGQTNPGGAFPPPPGQRQAPAQDPAFPPPPGARQTPAQDSAFPPPPSPGQASLRGGISVAPGGGGSFSPAPSGGGFPSPSGGGFSPPAPAGPSEAQRVCMTFPTIREETEKAAAAIKTAGNRKASREEVCPLFKTFAAHEAKLVAFLSTNQKLCGVPPNIVAQVKKNHANTIRIRNNVCSAAPVAGGAAGPTLSDALGGPVIADDQTAKLPNRGTFDTLTGNALQK